MRLGHVIGRVVLSQQDPAYTGGRFLLVQPLDKAQFKGAGVTPLAKGNSLVVYDSLGAGVGNVIGFTEGAEATAPLTFFPPCPKSSRPVKPRNSSAKVNSRPPAPS
jgi:ethanolamine utilization protein EutN